MNTILDNRALAYLNQEWWTRHASALARSRRLAMDAGRVLDYASLATPHALAERRAQGARGEWRRIAGGGQ